MNDIIKTSICHECGHYMVSDVLVDTEYGSIRYADREENVYAFPVQKGKICPYFVKGENNETSPTI